MTVHSAWTCVIWDVDGTVADASAGILPRLSTVLTAFGRTPPSGDEIANWIGPPMLESLQTRGGLAPDEAQRAIEMYRELVAESSPGDSVELYAGVPELIAELAAHTVPQATASTKPQNQVRSIFDHFGLAQYFAFLGGAMEHPGVIDSKADVLGRTLDELRKQNIDTSRAVLIGDRHHDIDGANEHGVPVIFVAWGFGRPGEEDGAIDVVENVDQLRSLLLTDSTA